ncbi:MAG TPA: M17 family peptidase N-terminal domain-containing protein, partial [Bryobacteraceae bacterium]|nr:M17 family peptidase N-terminal domain-containing protein [Bryobacteraceae bacterium]
METKLLYQPLDKVEADALVCVLYEGDSSPAELKFAAAWIEELKNSGEFSGKGEELATLYQPQGWRAKRLVVVGGGKRDKFDARKCAGAAVRVLKEKGVKRLAWALLGADAEAIVEGALAGNYEPDHLKTSDQGKSLEAFHVVAAANGAEIDKAFERGVILADSQNFARDLANEPANRMTPSMLA